MKLFLFLGLLVGMVTNSLAERLYIDSAIAIVEDDVITNQELAIEVEKIRTELLAKGRSLPADTLLNRQVLELMIDKSILLQQARSRGVTITDTQLNTALQNLARRNQMTLEQFRLTLLKNGLEYSQFRKDLRDELTIQRIKAGYAASNAEVSDQEVDEFIERNRGIQQSLEYRLNHILIALPDGADSATVTAAREEIEGLRQQVLQGADFNRVASEFSDGGNAIEGGDLGWRRLAQTPSLFAGFVPSMKIGDVSEVIRSANGFHIVQLADRRDSDKVFVEQIRARHILIQPDEVTTSQQAREKLEQIRQQIVEGADFSALAEKYSDDHASGGLGGDLGWFAEGVMVKEFQEVAETTPIGQLSPVFESPFGWHLLEVLGRRKVDETDESKRAKIRKQLKEQKEAEVLELWQRRLRDEAFVKVMGDA